MPSHTQIIELSAANLHLWPEYQKLVSDGKARFDGKGRLRYSHGAPVGKLIFARVRKDGAPVYRESAEEWFDPDSPKAQAFIWP